MTAGTVVSRRSLNVLLMLAAFATPSIGVAQDGVTGKSFIETFDRIDSSVWYISDGWNNGPRSR
jgi:endo-1,3-1,4-beta-glycanase ExoK